MRRALAGVALLAVVAGGAVLAVAAGSSGASSTTSTTIPTASTAVRRTTLVERHEVDGTLGYGEARTVGTRATGTLTGRSDLGSVVDRNGVLYEVDGKPVRLLYGKVPAYRRLAQGVDPGADVLQLEQNLKETGLANGLIDKPDAKWDSATTAAVKRWQKSLGADQDGVVEDGEVVFAPGAVRVAGHEAETGAQLQPGGAVLEVTGTTRQIDVDLDARKQRLAHQGAKVEVELPDGTTVTGTITSVGTVARQESSGEDGGSGESDDDATIDVAVVLDDAGAGASLDGAPVKVRLTSQSRDNVLAVPVHALLALAEGGYAVEAADGSRRLVKAETGLFSDGLVEVSGEGLSEGMKVVVPK